MANLSNYLENALVNHVLRNTALTSPTTVYVALYTNAQDATGDANLEADTGTEVTGGAYARKAVTFGAPSNGATDNTGVITFDQASADWGNIGYMGVRDALAAGNLLFWGRTTVIRNVLNGDTYRINTGDLDCSLA